MYLLLIFLFCVKHAHQSQSAPADLEKEAIEEGTEDLTGPEEEGHLVTEPADAVTDETNGM